MVEQRFGLVWEDHIEEIGASLGKSILMEVKEREIKLGEVDNILIEGDNLHSLQLLKGTYKGKVNVVYIDPPYNTRNKSFRYEDKFFSSTDKFPHSKWLSFMSSRLKLAKELMSEEGVIFISIDDREYAVLKLLCDIIFEEKNHLGTIIQNKGNAQNDAKNIQRNHEYILTYAKGKRYEGKKELPLLLKKETEKKKVEKDKYGNFYYKGSGIVNGVLDRVLNTRHNLGYTIYYNPKTEDLLGVSDYDKEKAKYSNDEEEVYQDNIDLLEKGYIKIRPPKKREKLGCWTWSLDKFNNEKDRILISKTRTGWSVVKKEYVDSEKVIKEGNTYYFLKEKMTNLKSVVDFSTSQGTTALRNVLHTSSFNNPKNIEMLKYLISSYYKQDNLIVLDFFAGSGSTGQAVLELNKEDGGNRKFILCTNNEVGEKSEEEFNKRYGNKKKNSKEWQDWEETNGICRIVTYPRIKGVIEGYKTVKGKVVEGVPANLKYYRIKYFKN